MKRMVRTYISGFLVAAFALSAVLCCCAGESLRAYFVKKTFACAACHAEKSAQSKEQQTCRCSSEKAVLSELPQAFQTVAVSFLKHWPVPGVIATFNHGLRMGALRTAYGGASPGQFASVPLYLQQRSLRI